MKYLTTGDLPGKLNKLDRCYKSRMVPAGFLHLSDAARFFISIGRWSETDGRECAWPLHPGEEGKRQPVHLTSPLPLIISYYKMQMSSLQKGNSLKYKISRKKRRNFLSSFSYVNTTVGFWSLFL